MHIAYFLNFERLQGRNVKMGNIDIDGWEERTLVKMGNLRGLGKKSFEFLVLTRRAGF